jgi:hypothetical protein
MDQVVLEHSQIAIFYLQQDWATLYIGFGQLIFFLTTWGFAASDQDDAVAIISGQDLVSISTKLLTFEEKSTWLDEFDPRSSNITHLTQLTTYAPTNEENALDPVTVNGNGTGWYTEHDTISTSVCRFLNMLM